MNLNSSPASPSPFPIHDHQIYNGDIDHPFGGTNNLSSSPAAVSCHIFFDSAAQDHMRYYNQQDQIYKLPQHISDEYRNHGYEIKNKVNIADQSGQLKLTLWKKQADHDGSLYQDNHHPMKWMKSHPSRVTLKIRNKTTNNLSSNSSASYTDNNNNPIRVCSDCNTTKTPLWRSGPKGPKSLCNACGIRQRKARRAMAAAAAANGNKADNIQPSMKIKGKNGGALKKRFKTGINSEAAASSSNVLQQNKKIGFEDFLINLSNNLSFHRVFPEDEKDAAILLMALSSGLVHG